MPCREIRMTKSDRSRNGIRGWLAVFLVWQYALLLDALSGIYTVWTVFSQVPPMGGDYAAAARSADVAVIFMHVVESCMGGIGIWMIHTRHPRTRRYFLVWLPIAIALELLRLYVFVLMNAPAPLSTMPQGMPLYEAIVVIALISLSWLYWWRSERVKSTFPAGPASAGPLVGIRGWLAVFIGGQFVVLLGHLGEIINIRESFSDPLVRGPLGKDLRVKMALTIATAAIIVMTLLMLYLRRPKSRQFILVSMPLLMILCLLQIHIHTLIDIAAIGHSIMGLELATEVRGHIMPLIVLIYLAYCCGWWAYWLRSDRVRQTFHSVSAPFISLPGIAFGNHPLNRGRWTGNQVSVLFAGVVLAASLVVKALEIPTRTPSANPAALSAMTGNSNPSNADLGIAVSSKVVTVIPFYWKPHETALEQTRVVIRAEIDGWHGLVSLDLGARTAMLNRTFLQPSPTGGVDSVTDANRLPDHTPHTNYIDEHPRDWEGARVTLRLGTLIDTFDNSGMTQALDDPTPHRYNALLGHWWGNFSHDLSPRLGNIGPAVYEQFETIIDYTHRRVVFIRLDTAGHRLADVPAYTPKWTAPLIVMHDSLGKDLGLAVGQYNTLDTLHTANNTLVRMLDTGAPHSVGRILGYDFLSGLGAFGLNQRSHQFILYY